MANLFGGQEHEGHALACSDYVVAEQRTEGYWEYPPVPTRKGKIATVEGNIATIGLLESYRRTCSRAYLMAAKQWYEFLTTEIGFRKRMMHWRSTTGPVRHRLACRTTRR